MKVLVTGGTGFLGRHLVERLALEGDEVWVLARGGKSDAELRGLGVHVVAGDVRQWASLRKAVEGKPLDQVPPQESGTARDQDLHRPRPPKPTVAYPVPRPICSHT